MRKKYYFYVECYCYLNFGLSFTTSKKIYTFNRVLLLLLKIYRRIIKSFIEVLITIGGNFHIERINRRKSLFKQTRLNAPTGHHKNFLCLCKFHTFECYFLHRALVISKMILLRSNIISYRLTLCFLHFVCANDVQNF